MIATHPPQRLALPPVLIRGFLRRAMSSTTGLLGKTTGLLGKKGEHSST
ncbi:MAG: hypothetical protein QGH53_05695 [Prochlorococcaceae cyanobacterium ETNP18_MAG_1]|nr:hypothetical protein [Prochlorococcaceae cyanobacterium ETNP18_MAG_1]